MPLSTNRTTTTGAGDHRDDHNTLHTLHNALENAPRGIVATGSRTTNFTLETWQQDIPNLSVTFTTVAGRRYRCSANMKLYIYEGSNGAAYAGLVEAQLLLDDNVVDYDHIMGNHLYLGNSDKTYLEYVTLSAPTAASHTWKVQARYTDSSGPSSVMGSTQQPAYIILEDIGV